MAFDETFWVGTSFVLFVALVYKPVASFITKGLDNRADRIQKELDEALRLKEEAQALLASYQRKQQQAEADAKDIVTHAQEEAKRLLKEAEEELEASLNVRIEMAMKKIANYENSVVSEVRNNAVDVAIEAVKDLVTQRLELDPKAADSLVDDSIDNLSKKLA